MSGATERGDVSATTALYGVAGSPIHQSMSPVLHNAAFGALGVDAVSVAFDAAERDASAVVDALRRLGVRGLSVTMPLKVAVAVHCDERSEVVERIGSANCLIRLDDGRVRADSTDGVGVLEALRCCGPVEFTGARFAVLGAGGAARAAIEALGSAGAGEVIVVARREGAAAEAAAVAPCARAGSAEEAADALVVVQATPIGMSGTDTEHAPPLLDPGVLGAGQFAVDLVYHPRVTPWLARAEAAGAVIVEGIDVLVHQAAASLELWLCTEPPIEVLHESVREP